MKIGIRGSTRGRRRKRTSRTNKIRITNNIEGHITQREGPGIEGRKTKINMRSR